MRGLTVLLGATLIAACPMVHAQAPKGEGVRFDCAQAKDPRACEERRDKMNATRKRARAACEGRRGAEHDECMVKELCAQARDPARCEAAGRDRMARRERVREACKDKRGEELKACIRAL